MGNVFFIADTHFGHENIIKYENRPFLSVKEMDQYMIERWNEVVGVDDEVFHIGDFSFYSNPVNESILKKLKGKKYLVIGNHDKESVAQYYSIGFQGVYDFPILYNGFWILSHEPVYINQNMPYANIFGHVHANPQYKDVSSQSFCVSVERIEYRPILFEEIKKRMHILN